MRLFFQCCLSTSPLLRRLRQRKRGKRAGFFVLLCRLWREAGLWELYSWAAASQIHLRLVEAGLFFTLSSESVESHGKNLLKRGLCWAGRLRLIRVNWPPIPPEWRCNLASLGLLWSALSAQSRKPPYRNQSICHSQIWAEKLPLARRCGRLETSIYNLDGRITWKLVLNRWEGMMSNRWHLQQLASHIIGSEHP